MCWLLVFILSTIITTMYSLIWGNCKFVSGQENIDFYQFHFLFPSGSQRDNLMILGGHDKDLFCQGYIQRGEIMFLASSASSFLVLMSLVHFLMSMSANYANIRGQDKFTELRVILFYPRTWTKRGTFFRCWLGWLFFHRSKANQTPWREYF